MFEKIHVYDLDGVLVDSSHRYRNKPDGTIDLPYWFANRVPEKIAKDRLLPLAKQYIADAISDHVYTVICTSRAWHVNDVEFIVGRLGAPDKLIMRPEGNKEPDGILKRKALRPLFSLRQFRNLPRALWEDNRHNIAALSELFDRVTLVQSNQGA
jgi:hypothetical protein